MRNDLVLREYSLRLSKKDVIVYGKPELLESPVVVKALHDGVQFRRASLDAKKTHKLESVGNRFRTSLSLPDLEAGAYELVEEESDADTLTYRLPE